MNIINVTQGSAEWHEHRARHWNASDAPAMMGCSPFGETRNELMHRMWLQRNGMPLPEVPPARQRLFDEGHRTERLCRPEAERELDDDLAPLVVTNGRYSASLDGVTIGCKLKWEHKMLNADLREVMPKSPEIRVLTAGGDALPLGYRVQIAHQDYCAPAVQQTMFTASEWDEEGRLIDIRHCWVKRDPELIAKVIAGWEQFERDLAEYTPPATTVPVVATPVEALPAVSVRVDGALMVTGNLPAFGVALKAFIERIPKQPSTDQEFADAEAACKALKRAEEALEAAKNSALGSMDSVEAMLRMVEDFRAIARSSRLVAEKAVQHRKDQLREDECRRGLKAVQVAVESANRDLGGTFIVGAGRQVFADAIKGLKTMESLRNAVDTAVAREKIVINQAAERVCGNLATIDKAGLPALFADRATLVHKDPEAVAAIVSQRVAEHRAAEDRRLEADRERIRAEERARAEADAAITRAATATPAAAQAAPVAAEQAQAVVEAPEGPTDAPTLKLGQINDRLGFTVTEAFLASIGVPCAGHDKRAVLFRESQWQVIKAKLIERIRGLA